MLKDFRSIITNKVLLIGALGYFVDLYDLVLYGTVRISSLRALQIPEDQIFSVGTTLLNLQMGGMLAGGVAFGVLGDKKGRRSALFGSILLYSTATFLNAFVQNVPQYAALRFLAGMGLAGELGAAITLVTETLPLNVRGLGSALIASIGFIGAALSSGIAQQMSWQAAYVSGGLLGFLLLFARFGLVESHVYTESRQSNQAVHWGSFFHFIFSKSRLSRLLLTLLVGIPIWYVAGVLSYFSPEFAKAYHVQGDVTAGTTIMVGYLGAMIGDLMCGILSHHLKSRKKAVLYFLLAGAALAISHFFLMENTSANIFYLVRFLIGVGNGYFAILIAWIAELYGTNLRATASIFIANLIRASVIPLMAIIQLLNPHFGLIQSGLWLGAVVYFFAIIATLCLEETFSKKAQYIEI